MGARRFPTLRSAHLEGAFAPHELSALGLGELSTIYSGEKSSSEVEHQKRDPSDSELRVILCPDDSHRKAHNSDQSSAYRGVGKVVTEQGVGGDPRRKKHNHGR
jgi:hypothetical protein